MKKHVLLAVACLATMTTGAQNIAVVNSNNKTTIYQMLDSALVHAEDGDVIYLPGGGFKVNDATKIKKRVTIMGVSHRGDTDNSDGATIIVGNPQFQEGSSGSAVIGAYVTGTVNIGNDGSSVNNIVIRYCSLGAINVNNGSCTGIVVNQNYIRGLANFNGSNPLISNNITTGMIGINGGTVEYNILTGSARTSDYGSRILSANNSVVSYNVFMGSNWERFSSINTTVDGSNNQGFKNMTKGTSWGDDCVDIGQTEWADVFEYNAGISVKSKFIFKGDYIKYKNIIGLYAGDSFNDDQVAPIPRIVSKKVDEQTSADGTLTVTVTIKAQ